MTSTSGSLPVGAADDYRRDGYFLARGLLTRDEARTLRSEGHAIIDRLAGHHEIRATWKAVDATEVGPTDLFHCHDLQFHSGLFNRTLCDQRLTGAFVSLMGTGNIQLHHNKLFIKPAERGSPFPLHQDWPFFPHADDSSMAAIVHLDGAAEAKGCLRVVPGSHHRGRLDHEGEKEWYLPADAIDTTEAIAVPAEPGDVLFFSCLTVHGSGLNRTPQPRTTWLIQVRDPADLPTETRHLSPGQGTMLAGTNDSTAPPPTSLGHGQ